MVKNNFSTEIQSSIKLHALLLVVLFTNVLTSHYLLPQFNQGHDFLFFSTWSLFSGPPDKEIRDLTWDNGKTYFFRDHRSSPLASEINIHTFFYLLNNKKLQRIKTDYVPAIEFFCKCHDIQVQELSGSIHEHIILKKKLRILQSYAL